MKEQRHRGSDKLTEKVRRRAEVTHTRFSPGEPEIARLLLDRLPPEMITAAKVLLDVIHSQEASPQPWSFDSDTRVDLSPERALLKLEVEDLLYRALWFADEHTLHISQLRSIFQLSGIHEKHFTNPIAKAIHQEKQNWSSPREVHQGLVKRMYIGPGWVIDELDIEFTPSDLQKLVFYMLNQTGELVEDRSRRLDNRIKLSPSLVKKIKLFLS